MVATAEIIPVNPQEDDYKVTVAGNQVHDDVEEMYIGAWVEEMDGIDSIGMEGGGEFIVINAEKGYDLVVEENQFGQARLKAIEQ